MSVSGSDQQSLHEGVTLLAGNDDLNIKLFNLVKLAAQAAKSSSASLYMVDAENAVLKPAVIYGLPDSYVQGCGEVAIGDQCCGRAVQHKKPWIVADMLSDPLFTNGREASVQSGIRAAFSVPVTDTSGNVLASLACHYSAPYKATNYDIERNRLFATLIAFAISTASNGNGEQAGSNGNGQHA
ncbi:MAG: domain S-box protein [Acidobacteriales bacterium]|nr:domain S-box protein [Terriglobales bacterium]